MDQSITEETKKALQGLGLTDYESRAYLALLVKGALTANQVSEQSGVPYSKVYEALTSLERKGWVETEHGRPSRYYPKAPSEAMETVKQQLTDRVSEWEKTILGELEPLYEHREIKEKPDLWILRGEVNIVARLEEMLENTRSELMIAAPLLPKTLTDAATAMLSHMPNFNVKVFFMVSKAAKSWNLHKIAERAEVRVRDHMFGGGVVSDGKEAMLFLGEDKPTLVIWSNHAGLVRFAKEYFNYLWDSSEKAD